MKLFHRTLCLVATGWVAVVAFDLGCGSRTGILALETGEGDDGGSGSEGGFDAPEEMDLDAVTEADSTRPRPDSSRTDGSSGPPPPSCVSGGEGMNNCGVDKNQSCCATLEVIGGTYYRTYTNMGTGPTGEHDQATVSTFQLDKYEVTVGRFRQFVQAWNNGSGFLPAAGSGKHVHLNGGQGLANGSTPGTFETGWIASDDANVNPTNSGLHCDPPGLSYASWTDKPGMNENLPMNCTNWWEAYAFCIYDGGFLPSQAEWEYAAAGGDQQREYPWGEIEPGGDTQYAIYECDYSGGECAVGQSLAPVGTTVLGAGRWGQYDLAGSLAEWNLDWVEMFPPYPDPCTDCALLNPPDPPPPPDRIIRGGAFDDNGVFINPWYVDYDDPQGRANGVGFRCARPPIGFMGDP
jgi:sulfatase modifying factor 1